MLGVMEKNEPESAKMKLMKAIRIHNYGGPEVLQYEDAPRPEPGAGEVLIRVHASWCEPDRLESS